MKQKIEIEYSEAEFVSIVNFCQSMTDGLMGMFQNIAKMDLDRRENNRKQNLKSKIDSVSENLSQTTDHMEENLHEIKRGINGIQSDIKSLYRRLDLVEQQVENIEDNDITPKY